MEERVTKHLELTQAVINRMAGNSFFLKGWSVTLSAGVMAFAASQEPNPLLMFLAMFPALSFWGLDAYYLRQEKLFPKLYDDIRTKPDGVEPFAMSTAKYETMVESWGSLLLSRTVAALHGVVVLVVAVLVAVVVCRSS